MRCPYCQTLLKLEAAICTSCGRFINPQVEQLIEQAAAEIKANSPQAKTTFEQVASLVSPQDQPYLRQRIRDMVENPLQDSPTAEIEQTMVSVPFPAAGVSGMEAAVEPPSPAPVEPVPSPPQPASSPAPVSPPVAVSQPPARHPHPPTGKATQAIVMDFNQNPREIIRIMDEAHQKARADNTQRKRWYLLLGLLFLAGLPFLCFDLSMGYNTLTFSLVTVILWLGALAGLILLIRQGRPPQFGPKFDLARTIFETIKDDVSPKKTLLGWLDLTGAEQESKAIRHKKSQSGQPVIYYRDEWLRLKAGLYDGNVLRMTLTERVKARQGYWKRSRSGKHKWRSGSSQQEYEMELSVSVSPGQYQIEPISAGSTIPNSRFVIQQAEAGDGRIVIEAAAASSFDAWDVLNVMRFGYDHLHK